MVVERSVLALHIREVGISGYKIFVSERVCLCIDHIIGRQMSVATHMGVVAAIAVADSTMATATNRRKANASCC